MKYLCIVLFALLAIHYATATSVVDRLKIRVKLSAEEFSEGSVGATRLVSSPSFSMGSPIGSSVGSVLSNSMGSAGGGSSCNPQPACNNGLGDSGDSGAGGMSVDDAVKPIEDWMKDFKRRTGDATDLYAAAKVTVKPLIDKLKRNQRNAQERLRESNEAILKHVEDAATQHIYALLKIDKEKMQAQEHKEELANKVLDAKQKERQLKEEHAAVLGLGSEHSKAIESALKSAGVKPSKTVVDHIAQILESSQASSSAASLVSSLAKAVSKAKKK